MKGEERERVLVKASWISVVGNAVLSVGKIAVGLLSGSLAVLSDGIDSATDVVISLVTLFTARIVNRPPDRKYAYGYRKAEDVATKVLSFIIFFAGVQMFVSSIRAVFSNEPREIPAVIAIYVTVLSMAGKLLLSWYQFRQGRRADSPMLIANAKNLRNDVLISAGVLAGLVFTFMLDLPVLDAITSLLISLYIIKSAIDIFMETNVVLMDGISDPTLYGKIIAAVESVPGASNPHRIRSRPIGNQYEISLDVEMDGHLTLKDAHAIAQEVEKTIRREVENVYDIVVHAEPSGTHHEKEKFGVNKDML